MRSTDVPNLWVMTAGPIPPSPVELLTGPRLGQLMDELRPKVPNTSSSTARRCSAWLTRWCLAIRSNRCLYVAQASQTRKSHIKDAFKRLRIAGIVPRGVVLTKTTAQNTAYYTYDNYYGYGASDAPKSKPPKVPASYVPTEPSLKQA